MFVFFEVEVICFSKCFLSSLISNTWQSLIYIEEWIEYNGCLRAIQKMSFHCTYARIETEFEHAAETVHKLIRERNIIQHVKYFFQTNFATKNLW